MPYYFDCGVFFRCIINDGYLEFHPNESVLWMYIIWLSVLIIHYVTLTLLIMSELCHFTSWINLVVCLWTLYIMRWFNPDMCSINCDERRIPIPWHEMNWTPEGELNFGMLRKSRQKLKYVGEESTYTPGTIRAIPSWVLNRIAKLTSRKTSLHSEVVDKVYPDYVNSLCKAGFTDPDLPIMGNLWKMKVEKIDIENEKEPNVK